MLLFADIFVKIQTMRLEIKIEKIQNRMARKPKINSCSCEYLFKTFYYFLIILIDIAKLGADIYYINALDGQSVTQPAWFYLVFVLLEITSLASYLFDYSLVEHEYRTYYLDLLEYWDWDDDEDAEDPPTFPFTESHKDMSATLTMLLKVPLISILEYVYVERCEPAKSFNEFDLEDSVGPKIYLANSVLTIFLILPFAKRVAVNLYFLFFKKLDSQGKVFRFYSKPFIMLVHAFIIMSVGLTFKLLYNLNLFKLLRFSFSNEQEGECVEFSWKNLETKSFYYWDLFIIVTLFLGWLLTVFVFYTMRAAKFWGDGTDRITLILKNMTSFFDMNSESRKLLDLPPLETTEELKSGEKTENDSGPEKIEPKNSVQSTVSKDSDPEKTKLEKSSTRSSSSITGKNSDAKKSD